MTTIELTEIKTSLQMFTGTEQWHKWSMLFPRYYLTDGARYVAEKLGAYWLMDAIASWQLKPRVRAEYFQTWTLTLTTGKEARLVCDDGNGNQLAVQIIPYTDFPLPTQRLYYINDGERSTILLPSEY